VITDAEDQTARVWSLAANDWPLEDLVLLGQLLTGRQIDDTSALVPLEANSRESLRRAWQTLRAKYPREFAPAQRREAEALLQRSGNDPGPKGK